jgi:hypothetical protein
LVKGEPKKENKGHWIWQQPNAPVAVPPSVGGVNAANDQPAGGGTELQTIALVRKISDCQRWGDLL